MAKKGVRKSKKKKLPTKPSPKTEEKFIPTIEPARNPKMVNLRAKIHDVGMLTITVPEPMVDETLEKIWLTGFKQKLNNRQRTHQVYGPHLIDRIDVEPIY